MLFGCITLLGLCWLVHGTDDVTTGTLGYTMYYNGTIYTVSTSLSDTNEWADTMLIDNRNGTIDFVGTYTYAMTYIYENTILSYESYNLQGQLVVPGFHDVHVHAVEAGINEQLCYIEPDTPARDLAKAIQSCQTDGEEYLKLDNDWIIAAGVDIGLLLITIDTDFNEPLPITVLDEAYPNTPICILDSIGHGAVVNTAAIQRATMYHPNFESDLGGKVLRDPETNEYYGIVTESTQQIFRTAAFISNNTIHEQLAYDSLLSAIQIMNANGITSVSDAGGFWQQAQTESWQRALNENKLTVRARYEKNILFYHLHTVSH
jgi:predicted amidohydrolase YtcJ